MFGATETLVMFSRGVMKHRTTRTAPKYGNYAQRSMAYVGKCHLDHVYSGQGLVELTLKPTIDVCHCIGAINVVVCCYIALITKHHTALANGEHGARLTAHRVAVSNRISRNVPPLTRRLLLLNVVANCLID